MRVDSAVEAGSTVGIHYDAMIAKVVSHGPDRATAIRRLADVLRRSRVHGVITNTDLLLNILEDDEFGAARVHTALLDERLDAWTEPRLDRAVMQRHAVAAALAEATQAASTAPVLSRIPTAFRNLPSQPRVREYTLGDQAWRIEYQLRDGRLTASETVLRATPELVVLEVDGVVESYDVAVGPGWVDVHGPHGSVSLTPAPVFVDPADVVAEGSLLAPMPAAVVSVQVEAGQQVSKGDVVVVLEAMKMQHTITAPTDGVVSELDVSSGQQVEAGAVLAVIEGAEG